MKINLLKTHVKLVIFALFMIILTLFVTFSAGSLKPTPEIDVTDLIGEGGIVAVTLMWLIVTLVSRPPGKLTNLMTIGLVFMHTAVLADFLDEFLRYPAEYWWLSAYESIPAPIGMILMSIALYQWHEEQVQINQQLRKREMLFRDHGLIDFITGLYGAQYMQKQLDSLIAVSPQQNIQLLMVDIDYFDQFIVQHGDHAGDRILRELSELFLMNLRTTDLLCRYAGDRFIVMLTDSDQQQANLIQSQFEQALAGVSIKASDSMAATSFSFTLSACSREEFDNSEQAFAMLNERMEVNKQQRTQVA